MKGCSRDQLHYICLVFSQFQRKQILFKQSVLRVSMLWGQETYTGDSHEPGFLRMEPVSTRFYFRLAHRLNSHATVRSNSRLVELPGTTGWLHQATLPNQIE